MDDQLKKRLNLPQLAYLTIAAKELNRDELIQLRKYAKGIQTIIKYEHRTREKQSQKVLF